MVKISDLVNGNETTEPKVKIQPTTKCVGNTALQTQEVVEEKQEKKKEKHKSEVSGKFTPVFKVLSANIKKIKGCSCIEIKHENVPDEKYMFFVDENPDADIHIMNVENLQLLHTDCVEIKVITKGVVITGKNHRTYVQPTRSIQYLLNGDGFPITKIIISKVSVNGGDPSYQEITEMPPTLDDPQKFLVQLKGDAVTLYNIITNSDKIDKDKLQSLELMKKEALDFLNKTKDINYLIKVEDILIKTN